MAYNFDNNSPIYLQLCEIFRIKIVSGELKPGERLDTVRAFAEEYGVNPNTVQRALSELENDGLVYSKRTVGRFVTEEKGILLKEKRRLAKEEIRGFIERLMAIGFTKEEIVSSLRLSLKGDETDDI